MSRRRGSAAAEALEPNARSPRPRSKRLLRRSSNSRPRLRNRGRAAGLRPLPAAPPPSQLPGDAGVQPNYRSQFVSNIPAGFDVEGFLKESRRNFLRLQEANDRGDLARLRQVTTEDMFKPVNGASGWLLAGMQQPG